MQLTPRGLVMAGTAMLVGGAVFGIVTSLAPTATVTDPTPAPSASTSWSDAELGDQVTTYPSSSSSLTATPSAAPATASEVAPQTPTPSVSSTPSPSPSLTESAPSSSALPSTTTKTTPQATPRTTPRATARPTTSPRPAQARTEPPAARPTPRAPRPTTRAAAPRSGWSAPVLLVGVNDVRPPSLTSGARVQVTVACSPSRACTVSGSDLTIDPAAESVTVTWSAPARARYRAWSVSRGL